MSKEEIKVLFEQFYKDMEEYSVNKEEVLNEMRYFLDISPNGQDVKLEVLKVTQFEKGTMIGVNVKLENMAGLHTELYLQRKIA